MDEQFRTVRAQPDGPYQLQSREQEIVRRYWKDELFARCLEIYRQTEKDGQSAEQRGAPVVPRGEAPEKYEVTGR